jgi:hypothetical protein
MRALAMLFAFTVRPRRSTFVKMHNVRSWTEANVGLGVLSNVG